MSNVKLSQDYIVFTQKQPKAYLINEADWSRIKKMLQNMRQTKKVYSTLSSIFFGMFGSSIFSIISLLTVKPLPNWILPTNIAICVSTLILGIVLLIIDNQQKEMIESSSKIIMDEVKDIEDRFERE